MTQAYLDLPTTKASINAIATELVSIRLERAKTERWEQFATDVSYRCPIGSDCKTIYETRDKLREHMKSELHNSTTETECENNLRIGRIMNKRGAN